MQILTVNTGSSSLKITIFDRTLAKIVEAHLKEMQSPHPHLEMTGQAKQILNKPITLKDSFELVYQAISAIYPLDIHIIGHRVVHGGNLFYSSTIIDQTVLDQIKSISHLAPLHNPACIEVIEASQEILPEALQLAVFDTAFHHTIPPHASIYGIPRRLSDAHGIKKYGFHGISHQYLWNKYAEQIPHKEKIITVHLGNGCSMCAIHNGKSMDTSMGFTPIEGLLMSTRSGEIDPGVLEFLCLQENISISSLLQILNKESGLLGISNSTSDMKELIEQSPHNDACQLAIDIFCYRIVKYIGAYAATLAGLDAIVFSGGIGENSPFIRKKVIQDFSWVNWSVDDTKNTLAINPKPGAIIPIHSNHSAVSLFVVGTDENAFIANECLKVHTF